MHVVACCLLADVKHLVPVGSRITLVSTAAASRERPVLGHQATQCTMPPRLQVRLQRPVRTSHSFTLPSSEADASHCPEGSGLMLRTCIHNDTVTARFDHTMQVQRCDVENVTIGCREKRQEASVRLTCRMQMLSSLAKWVCCAIHTCILMPGGSSPCRHLLTNTF